jgi:acyl carrier protein
MGLDPLEICWGLEKRFGISMRRPARWAFLTAGTLNEFVWQKLQGIQPGVPDDAEVRKEIHDALPPRPPKRWWFQHNHFDELFTNGSVDENWQRFQHALGLQLPPLEHCQETNTLGLPRGFRTEASVILWIMKHHPERVTWLEPPSATDRPPGAEQITRDECWLGVRQVLADVLVLDPDKVTPEAHLIEDLGMV